MLDSPFRERYGRRELTSWVGGGGVLNETGEPNDANDRDAGVWLAL